MEFSSKCQQEVNPNEYDFYIIAKEIQNQSGQLLIVPGTKDCHFCENFGCGAAVALVLWQMLSAHNLFLSGGQIIHTFLTLYFLKQYPKQDAGFAAVSKFGGVVDPKIFHKYVHPFICSIASLEIYVVSIFIFYNSLLSIIFLTSYQNLQNIFLDFFYRSCLTTVSKVTITMIA